MCRSQSTTKIEPLASYYVKKEDQHSQETSGSAETQLQILGRDQTEKRRILILIHETSSSPHSLQIRGKASNNVENKTTVTSYVLLMASL